MNGSRYISPEWTNLTLYKQTRCADLSAPQIGLVEILGLREKQNRCFSAASLGSGQMSGGAKHRQLHQRRFRRSIPRPHPQERGRTIRRLPREMEVELAIAAIGGLWFDFKPCS